MSKFQLALMAIFGLFIVVGVILFSLFRGGGGGRGATEQITIWGTVSESVFTKYIEEVNNLKKGSDISINYVEKEPDSFNNEFIEALASATGPDAILLPQDVILRHKDKIFPIPYSSLSERIFKDTFIEEGELYLFSEGAIALPFISDPLVMYWNRDIFTNAFLTQPPSYWDEFFSLADKITRKDENLNILKSALSFGEFRNVANAKEIFSTLIMQAGNPIVMSEKGELRSVLAEQFGFSIPPTEAALRFYTEFSNPSKSAYSWNRALPLSRSYFLSGDLATYFGFASELSDIKLKNPNLNFDVASMPQRRDAKTKITFGRIQGFALVKSSKKLSSAFSVISELTGKDNISVWTKVSSLPPVRRDLLAVMPTDQTGSILYSSAIISKGWLDPDKEKTQSIFQNMVESTLSGKSRLAEAVRQANSEIQNILLKR